jgi:hypothetical protein
MVRNNINNITRTDYLHEWNERGVKYLPWLYFVEQQEHYIIQYLDWICLETFLVVHGYSVTDENGEVEDFDELWSKIIEHYKKIEERRVSRQARSRTS